MRVEDNLAKFWRDSLEWQYGKPRIDKTPNGTESDRYWKVRFGNIELTVHFYNHNKYKDKKQSKLMILGSTMCEYVFTELPNIYKIVCSKSVSVPDPVIDSKRKRLVTPNSKRNIRFKSASKPDGNECALCDFISQSTVNMIKAHKI